MAFDDDGFLSSDHVAWTATTRAQFKEWFDLVESFNREAMKILFSIKPCQSKNQQLVAASLYGRALQSFQGAVIMAERGLIAGARSLVRSCAETAFAIGSVAVDDKFVHALIEDYQNHRLRHANAILNDPESRRELTSEQVNNLQQVVAEVTGQYQRPRPQGIIWEQAARNAKMTALYDTIYRMTSGDAAHTTVLALDRHIQADNQGRIGQLTFRPESRELVQTLSMATNALVGKTNPIANPARVNTSALLHLKQIWVLRREPQFLSGRASNAPSRNQRNTALHDALRAARVKLMPEQVEYLKRGILWGADST